MPPKKILLIQLVLLVNVICQIDPINKTRLNVTHQSIFPKAYRPKDENEVLQICAYLARYKHTDFVGKSTNYSSEGTEFIYSLWARAKNWL